jgi:hypothetical protein
MSLAGAGTEYELVDTPLSPVEGGTSLLVTGSREVGLDALVHRLLSVRDGGEEGVVGITTDRDSRRFRRTHRRESVGSRQASVGVVDCCGDPGGRTDDETVLAEPDDLTAVNMQFSSLCDELQFDGVERVRSGLVTVSPLCAACEDMRDVYRFVSNVTSRNRRSEGLFVCAIDPDADTGEFNDGQNIAEGLSRAFDGRLDLRRDGRETQVRVEGLDDQPGGWQSVSL